MRILLADDSIAMRRLQKHFLNMMGVDDIIETRDGLETLNMLTSQKFDLVLCDIGMPEINGVDVLREFRETDTETPFLMVTATTETDAITEAMEAGCTDYITKPFSPDEYVERLERWVELCPVD